MVSGPPFAGELVRDPFDEYMRDGVRAASFRLLMQRTDHDLLRSLLRNAFAVGFSHGARWHAQEQRNAGD